ncbi:MAG: hypothetical protein WC262_12385 [Bacteroidales bacterium]|jgi:hypothetical protein
MRQKDTLDEIIRLVNRAGTYSQKQGETEQEAYRLVAEYLGLNPEDIDEYALGDAWVDSVLGQGQYTRKDLLEAIEHIKTAPRW